MKKLIIFAALLVSLTSCLDGIKLDKHKVILDGNEQDVTIKATTSIFDIWVDCDESVSYDKEVGAKKASGSWFETSVSTASSKEVRVAVSKNESGAERKIQIFLSNSMGNNDSCTITQKALK